MYRICQKEKKKIIMFSLDTFLGKWEIVEDLLLFLVESG